jgi:hypothetical protein
MLQSLSYQYSLLFVIGFASLSLAAEPAYLPQDPNTWVKRSPLPSAPPSPGLSYETSLGYDPVARRVIRWGGHAQGGVKGSGEQIAETWTLDPATMKWEYKQPNRSPPPVCCAQQNVFDADQNRFLRFKSFTGSHGWQWYREIYLNNSSVWSYDLATNTWRDLRPLPEPSVGSLRCASWDTDQHVAVVFGGEGRKEGTIVFDPYTNTWTRKHPRNEPTLGSTESRSGGNMTYDAARKLHILFGSQFSNDQHTWAYDLSKNEWRDLKPATLPPTDRNDAVLAYDSLNQVVVAVVRVADAMSGNEVVRAHLETWAYDTGSNHWKKMNPPSEPNATGGRSRVMTFVPDQNLLLMDAYVRTTERIPNVEREHQIWTYRFAPAKTSVTPQRRAEIARQQPRVVEDVVVSVVSAKEVRLSWQPPPGRVVAAGYHVERAIVEVFSEDEILRLKKDTPPLSEPSIGAIKRIGAFTRLTTEPLRKPQFVDRAIDLTVSQVVTGESIFQHRFSSGDLDAQGKPYRYAVFAYRIRALSESGEESGPSPYFLTIPSAPQHVFSREAGETCHLKWLANPESSIQGYRVYWMKGPRPEGPGQATHRLTAEPIREPHLSDETAGLDPRRYWIVAVDVLGQEGIPSSPTWHYRTQREFYKPFVSDWHQ